MNSFHLTAIGNLSNDPELVVRGGATYAKFCLVGDDYAGKDEQGNAREIVTTMWLVAFGGLGETIARNARKGDQLFVQGQVRSNNWIDTDGEQHFDHSFVAQSFRFGAPGKATREELARRSENELDEMRAAF